MPRDFFKNYVYPIAMLSGSIIGVGFLSLPYITLQVGIFVMLFYMAVLTALMITIHVIYGKIVLVTPDRKMLPGIIGYHLGRRAEIFTLFLVIGGSFGVLLAYLIIGGQFLATLLSPFLGGNDFIYTTMYFLVLSAIVYIGIRAISRLEFWALVLLFISFCIIFIKGFSQIHLENIFPTTNLFAADWKTIFLPYGAIIFSLWGTGLIPEAEEMLGGNKKLLKKIIIIATIIPAVIYTLFILLVLGISGAGTSDSALTGLKNFLGQGVFLVAILIGLTTTFTAFIAQGLLLKKMFMYDMKLGENISWAITCFVPFFLFLLGFNSFIPLISFTGGFVLSINGILILLIYKKIGGKNIMIFPLALVFILGILYEIIYFVK